MKIACLGWGSLVWKEDQYPHSTGGKWNIDGPLLPVEFVRISSTKLVTLVIDPGSKPVEVLWYLREAQNLEDEIDLLRKRENTPNIKNIHFVTSKQEHVTPVQAVVKDWLIRKKLDAAIWTGLSCKNTRNEVLKPSLEEVVQHLSGLDSNIKQEAKEYILKAPSQISTKYRKSILEHFGWE